MPAAIAIAAVAAPTTVMPPAAVITAPTNPETDVEDATIGAIAVYADHMLLPTVTNPLVTIMMTAAFVLVSFERSPIPRWRPVI